MDYDSDPGRWQAWESPQDVHEIIAPDLRGPILDVDCDEGRLASLLGDDVSWIGVDSSPTQLAANRYRPVVRADDMRALPFRDGAFAEVTHLWCLYYLADPMVTITEAARVLKPGGRYFTLAYPRASAVTTPRIDPNDPRVHAAEIPSSNGMNHMHTSRTTDHRLLISPPPSSGLSREQI